MSASKICSNPECKATFSPEFRLQDKCPECIKKQAQAFDDEIRRTEIRIRQDEARRLMDGLEAETRRELEHAGLAPRELDADLRIVPDEIKHRLPRAQVKQLLAGEIPEIGFGIGGATTGCGKTMTVAALAKAFVSAKLKRKAGVLERGQSVDAPSFAVGLYWCSWPSVAEELKELVACDCWGEISRATQSLHTVGLLVLDDLGRERIRKSYSEDFATGKLDSIIDTRYRNGLPTLFTTNLSSDKLAEVYGSGMVSRLLGANPIVELPANMRDLRVENVQEVYL